MAVVYLFNGFPIFAVRRLPVLRNHNPKRRGVGVAFDCPFCLGTHSHGMPSEGFGDKPSHRVAHCWEPDSPLRNGGHYLIEEDKANPGALPQKWAAVLETADIHRRNDSPEGMLPLGEVRAFIKAKHADARVGRSDALCWAYTGRRGVKLRTEEIGSQLYTTPQWVEEFMRAAGLAAA